MVWLEGLNPGVRAVKKVYSVETDIIQAFWCRFRATKKPHSGSGKDGDRGEIDQGKEGTKMSGEGVLCICVREQNCLTLFLQTGAVHYVPLPFLVSYKYMHTTHHFTTKCKAGLMDCCNVL